MSIDTIIPKKGEVAFKWFNKYAGIAITTPTKTVIIDPADVNPKMFQTADAVLLTHEHYDHLDETVVKDIFQRTQCQVIADPTSTKRLKSIIPQNKLQETHVGAEHKVGEITIRTEPCNHPPAATPVTFLITSEDGVKIYHTADSLPFSEMKRLGEQLKPHIAFCTVAIAPAASPQNGVEIAKLVKPEIAIPYHTASKADLTRFAEILSKQAPYIKSQIIEQGKTYKYPMREMR
ncbi:MAG: MBL fold metallo-hydrolase [Candidatus Bathyarchaeia archaeon]